MSRKRFSEGQIINILNEVENGLSVAEACRKFGCSDASIYKWKAKFRGLGVEEVRRIRELEDENRRLKQIVAEQALEILMLKDENTKFL